MENSYSAICRWTEKELTDNFQLGIKSFAEERGEDFTTTLHIQRDYYDGYVFSSKDEKI